jgi:hypothetical protein
MQLFILLLLVSTLGACASGASSQAADSPAAGSESARAVRHPECVWSCSPWSKPTRKHAPA